MGYRYFMNNPVGARVGDCAVRAISKALNISWEDAYAKLVVAGYQMALTDDGTGMVMPVGPMYGGNMGGFGSAITRATHHLTERCDHERKNTRKFQKTISRKTGRNYCFDNKVAIKLSTSDCCSDGRLL